jgi:Zn-dependent peptidase ImmA (M78 family)/transcriptional regulator with XRE-family HTH domain
VSAVDVRRLRLGRETAGLRKKDLAELIEVSPASITQYEAGRTVPPAATVARIALACGLSAEFFAASGSPSPASASKPFFRSLRSTRQWERDEAEARATLVWQVAQAIEQRVNLPALNLPDLHLSETDLPSAATGPARGLRELWGLPAGPVGNVAQLLEAHGAVVARLSGHSQRVDAFSQWMGGRPFVILWKVKADTARSRFDAAHELGHLLLHPDPEPGNKLLEDQAHAFAAEFLMPQEQILDELPRRAPRKADLSALVETRERWGVSISALYYRARELEVISPDAHRRAMIRLADLGYRVNEPGELGPPEQPRLLRDALALLSESTSWGLRQLAAEVHLPVELVREICAIDADGLHASGGQAVEAWLTDVDEPAQGVRAVSYAQFMAKKPEKRIVSRNPEGGWDVDKPGANRASANLPTQRDADKRAAEILRNVGGGERITKGMDGKIRSKDTIAPGNDPNPPKDREH